MYKNNKIQITWGKRTRDEMKNILIKWQRKYIEHIGIMSLKKKLNSYKKEVKNKKEKKKNPKG